MTPRRWGRLTLAWLLAGGMVSAAPGGVLGLRLQEALQRRAAAEYPHRAPLSDSRGMIPVLITGSPDFQVLDALGVVRHGRLGPVQSAQAPEHALDALAVVPGVEAVCLPAPMVLSLDVSAQSVGVQGLRGRVGGDWVGHTGEGVIVGIIDSGIDVIHEDFRRPDGGTRILYLWDQSGSGGTPPQEIASSYGNEYTAFEIDSGLVAHFDYLGHGTHVAGIAAGDGSSTGQGRPAYRFVGMAPEADLIVVAAELRADRIVDALQYLQSKAEALGKPLVVNMSLNTVTGPHNGREPLSRAVDAFAGPGRIPVVSAGNSGADSVHASCTVVPKGLCSLGARVTYPPPEEIPPSADTTRAFELELYYPRAESLAVTLELPDGATLGPVSPGETVPHTVTGAGTVFLSHDTAEDSTLNAVLVEVGNFSVEGATGPAPMAGEWRVLISNSGTEAVEVNGWVSRRFPMAVHWTEGFDPTRELGAPATAHHVLAVGSYNTKRCWESLDGEHCSALDGPGTALGEASWFSSRGPTLDGRLKPDIGAPGFAVMSSFSGSMAAPVRELWGVPGTLSDDGVHVMQAGTSMSSPHVAGAVALALALDPQITAEALVLRLEQSATQDAETGPGWGPVLGYGKLNVPGLLDATALDLPPPPRVRAAPNPFQEATRIAAWDLGAFTTATIYDLKGRVVRSLELVPGEHGEYQAEWNGTRGDGSPAAAGVYWIRVNAPGTGRALKVVRLP